MTEEHPEDPLESLLDLLLYAPIGLVIDCESVSPDLARRGRQHAMVARRIGELAVKSGLNRLDQFLEPSSPETGSDSGPSSSGSTEPPAAAAAGES